MEKCSIVFYRPRDEDADRPAVWHSYFIVAWDWQPPGSGIGMAVGMTAETPELPHPITVATGGAVRALLEARAAVERMEGNHGLQCLTDCPDERGTRASTTPEH
jgi:hypothetical protein